MGKIVDAYFLAGITVTLLCFASGKLSVDATDNEQKTDKSYNSGLPHLTDNDSLITAVEKLPREQVHSTRAHAHSTRVHVHSTRAHAHSNHAHAHSTRVNAQSNRAHAHSTRAHAHSNRGHAQPSRAHVGKITDIIVTNAHKIPLRWRENKIRRNEASFRNKAKQYLRKISHRDYSKNSASKIQKQKENSKKIIHRKSRDEGTIENDDSDESIRSKEEGEDEDVQLIIIPKKPQRHLPPKIQEEHNDKISENSMDDAGIFGKNSKNPNYQSENSKKDSQNSGSYSENVGKDSENTELESSKNYPESSKNYPESSKNYPESSKNYPESSKNYPGSSKNYPESSKNYPESSKNYPGIFKEPLAVPKNSQHRFKSYPGDDKNSHVKSAKNSNDGATVTLERVVPEEDDDESKKSHQSHRAGDYDLHLNVKDKSGTNVKLTGDLPASIGNLEAVGENGGRVQIKSTNTRGNAKRKSSKEFKIVDLQGDDSDSTTDEMARDLIKMKSGKLKHSPYPSTILLRPSGGVDANPKIDNEGNTNEDVDQLKSQKSDDSSQTSPALTSLTRDEASAKAERPTNQQSSNNIFAPMEFENGDDELMATSRLLDIAQKADDVSSLKDEKEGKQSSNEVKEPSKSLKGLTKGMPERQTSKAFLKSASPDTPEDYKKQTEDIDKEADENWYKLQSLEDRVVDEGSSAKTGGKDVGSYNGQKVSVVSPSQLQLLQTEYPTSPAYLTPLVRSRE